MSTKARGKLISFSLIKVPAFSDLKQTKLVIPSKGVYSPAFKCYRKAMGNQMCDLSPAGGFNLFFLSRSAVKADTGYSDYILWHFEGKTGV